MSGWHGEVVKIKFPQDVLKYFLFLEILKPNELLSLDVNACTWVRASVSVSSQPLNIRSEALVPWHKCLCLGASVWVCPPPMTMSIPKGVLMHLELIQPLPTLDPSLLCKRLAPIHPLCCNQWVAQYVLNAVLHNTGFTRGYSFCVYP